MRILLPLELWITKYVCTEFKVTEIQTTVSSIIEFSVHTEVRPLEV